MLVRLAREEEYVAAGHLTVAGYDADDYLIKPDGDYDQRYADWLVDAPSRGRDGHLLVAVDGEELLGTTTWCPPGSPYRELATQDHQGEFRTLAVSPAARGRGIGTALVSDCLLRAKEMGLTEMMICSLDDMAPAHRLYESFGFVRRPELDWSPVPGVQLWAFSLQLDPMEEGLTA
ncbi:GNAT family N-acetyltransferase [Aeromicrobium sp.]|uniref:GNAT family N-acetyltransferase n=1 Tax=Aeromicrobium sp. TaxID=1871063 RepID=UPI0019BF894F|nr:GNAT family N-acetyltransferase [Aeromicrobium sp.]MBC7629937.1 GNAT family N-acetyltransferase [Aeromicrobium sp.]